MTIEEIRNHPTSITEIPDGARAVHESCVRSYQVLEKVKDWCRQGASPDIILEMIYACYPQRKLDPESRMTAREFLGLTDRKGLA